MTNTSIEIESNGTYTIDLLGSQGIYQLDIIDSNDQYCTLNDALELDCNSFVCTADYRPVCAKEPNAGVVCITTPCDTDRYRTFSNACHARGANAWLAIETECLGLENVITEHIEPVFITKIHVIDINSDNYIISDTSINEDTLIIDFEISGGCGNYQFDLLVNDTFAESLPVQLSNVIIYKNNDPCDSVISFQKSFDLEPIKELFRRVYPDATGEQTVELPGMGLYTFVI